MGNARAILLFLATVSLFFGFLTYAPQLAKTPFFLQIFVPDCPLYVFLMVLVVFFAIHVKEFRLIIAVGMVKYGAWTLMIFVSYSAYYLEPDMFWQTVILFLGHILMIWGGLVILPSKPTRLAFGIVLGWLLLNDLMDYGFGLKPVFPDDHLRFVEIFSVVSTVVFSFALYYWCDAIRNLPFVAYGRKKLEVS
jgi:uncharacterized membrane protein YpjA